MKFLRVTVTLFDVTTKPEGSKLKSKRKFKPVNRDLLCMYGFNTAPPKSPCRLGDLSSGYLFGHGVLVIGMVEELNELERKEVN